MLSHSEQRNLYGKLTNNESSSNLSLGDTLITSETKRIIAKIGGNLLESEATGTTVALQQTYRLPNKVKKLRGITVSQGTTIWPLHESPSIRHWNEINSVGTSFTSDTPTWYRMFGRSVKLWPTPASSANVINYQFDKRVVENSVLDYRVGSIGTAVSGSAVVKANTAAGSTTAWTDSMEGRFILITETNDSNSGDGEWYEIESVTNGTTLVLETPYEGQNITNGTAVYVIGQVSPLLDGFHELPVYRAAEIYWSKNDEARAQLMRGIADRLEEELENANEETTNVNVEEEDMGLDNPNHFISNVG